MLVPSKREVIVQILNNCFCNYVSSTRGSPIVQRMIYKFKMFSELESTSIIHLYAFLVAELVLCGDHSPLRSGIVTSLRRTFLKTSSHLRLVFCDESYETVCAKNGVPGLLMRSF